VWKYIVYSLRIRRMEYRIAELPLFLIPVLLTVRHESAFLSLEFWEGLVIFLFIFAFGDLLNCLVDRDLDATYKPKLSQAVYGIGVRGVKLQAALSAIAALALAVHLAWLRDRWLLVPATAFALFTAFAYSVPPLQLKGRGLWQLAFYWLGLFAGPMLFTAMLFRDLPGWEVIAVALSYGLFQTGVLLVNTAEDYPEDRQMGVRTVIIALGIRRGIWTAFFVAVLGSGSLLTAFQAIHFHRRANSAGTIAFWMVAMLALTATCVATVVRRARLWNRVSCAAESDGIAAIKRAAKWVPLEITVGAIVSLMAALSAFLAARTSP
jgi:1,4-dihydroxy-2-naphthoate octaprenyltransferase